MKRIPLIIFGAGKVGRVLVGQLTAAAQYHAERDGLSFSVVAWCDSDGWPAQLACRAPARSNPPSSGWASNFPWMCRLRS